MIPMHPIWLTRPLEDNIDLAADLYRLGIPTINAPLLTIEPCAVVLPETLPDALLISSRHAASALPTSWTHLPVYCVGRATADAASERGYSEIRVGTSDVLELLPRIVTEMQGKSLVYFSGEDISVDIIPVLAAQQVQVARLVAYRAIAIQQLKPELRTALHLGKVSGVVFFSSRTATTANALLAKFDLSEATRSIAAYCLSLEVAKAAAQLPWRKYNVAHIPTRTVMIDMIRKQCGAH